MGFIKKLIVKMLGKRIDGALDKHGISKTKIIAVIGVVVYAIQKLGPQFGWDIQIPPDAFEVLGALGLWTLKDGLDGPKNEAIRG